MITLNRLSFRYSRKRELYKDLSLSLKTGSIYGLLGKNGAGKSTLLKMISGLLFPSSGSVLVNGHVPKKRQPSFLQTIYLIPEEVYVPPITIKKYVSLFGVFYPLFNEKDFYEYLRILEVEDTGKLTTLSFGQQKKFVIAFALACHTKVLILDEPTNGLDIPSKLRFRKLIASAMNEDRLIMISTHQIRDLDNLIDNIVIIDEGKLLMNASLEQISEELTFKKVESMPEEEVYYTEESFLGTSVVMKNKYGEHSKVNLEHLFNAVTTHPEISKFFSTSYSVTHE
jgi:ABC-2 type transport system ATP-binding protein